MNASSIPPGSHSEGINAENLPEYLSKYGSLSQEWQRIAAPFNVQIKALELQREDATVAYTYEMGCLDALIKPLVLTLKCTRKAPYISAIYIQKDKWDSPCLFQIAEEGEPRILQAYVDASYVTMRKTSR